MSVFGNGDKLGLKIWSLESFILLAAVAVKTAILIADAKVYGRLAVPPVYDDVSYFLDAVQRIAAFQSGGFPAVFSGLVALPPHAPYSTLSALTGFLMSGNSVASPYVMNSVAVACMTLAWMRMFRVGPLPSIAMIIFLVSNAWFDNTVMIFHPDLIAGYGTAIVASLLLFRHLTLDTPARQLTLGVLAGLVLLTKPTALPAVMVVWAIAFFFGMVASRVAGQRFSQIGTSTLIAVAAMFFVSFTYYYATLNEIYQYIYVNFFVTVDVQKKVYESISGKTDQYLFFWRLAESFFGWWLWLGLLLVVIASVGSVYARVPILISMIGLLICCLAADAIPSASPVRVMLFGALLYGMLVVTFMTAIHLLQRVVDGCADRAGLAPKAPLRSSEALLLLVVAMVATVEMKDGQAHFPASMLQYSGPEYDQIYAILAEQAAAKPLANPTLTVLIPVSTPIPPTDFSFRGLQNGLHFDIVARDFSTDIDELMLSARQANVTVLPDEKVLAGAPAFPVIKLMPEFYRRLSSDPNFKELRTVDLPIGQIHSFKRL